MNNLREWWRGGAPQSGPGMNQAEIQTNDLEGPGTVAMSDMRRRSTAVGAAQAEVCGGGLAAPGGSVAEVDGKKKASGWSWGWKKSNVHGEVAGRDERATSNYSDHTSKREELAYEQEPLTPMEGPSGVVFGGALGDQEKRVPGLIWDYVFCFRNGDLVLEKEGEDAAEVLKRDMKAVLSRLKAVGLVVSKRIVSSYKNRWYYLVGAPPPLLERMAEELQLVMRLTEKGIQARLHHRHLMIKAKNPVGVEIIVPRCAICTHEFYNQKDGEKGYFEMDPFGPGQFSSGYRQRIIHLLVTGTTDVTASGDINPMCGASIDVQGKKLFSRWPRVCADLMHLKYGTSKNYSDFSATYNAAPPRKSSGLGVTRIVKKVGHSAAKLAQRASSIRYPEAPDGLDSTTSSGGDLVDDAPVTVKVDEANDAVATRRRVFLDAFPLHNTEHHALLYRKWSLGLFHCPWGYIRSEKRWSWEQPLQDIRHYFGDRVGMYYCWLGFYTYFLHFVGLLGIGGAVTLWAAEGLARDITLCCYVGILTIWTEAFLKFWKREINTRMFTWKLSTRTDQEELRPEFVYANEKEGRVRPSPITGENEAYYPAWRRVFTQVFITWPIVLLLMGVVVFATIALLTLQKHLSTILGSTLAAVCAGAINVFGIKIMSWFFREKVGRTLTNLEYHRTLDRYENSLVAKTFAFQFINSYFTLIYVAFLKDGGVLLDGSIDSCPEDGCLSQLQQMFGIIFFTKVVLSKIVKVLRPLLLALRDAQSKRESCSYMIFRWIWKLDGVGGVEGQMNKAEYDVYGMMMDEYREMVVQFGYISMFAAAFPLASTIALINNVIEIRMASGILLRAYRRPFPFAINKMGMWEKILSFISWVAILTNGLILVLTSRSAERFGFETRFQKLLFLTLAEHVLVSIKFMVGWFIPDTPDWLQKRIARTEYRLKLQKSEVPQNGSQAREPVLYDSDEDEEVSVSAGANASEPLQA